MAEEDYQAKGPRVTGLAGTSDAELDRICETLSEINLAAFFFGQWRPMLTESARRPGCALPLILQDGNLLQRMMGG